MSTLVVERKYGAWFDIVHAPSNLPVIRSLWTRKKAERIRDEMESMDFDWTLPVEEIRKAVRESGEYRSAILAFKRDEFKQAK